MKRKLALILAGLLVLSLLSGCAGTIVVVENCTCPTEDQTVVEAPTAAPEVQPSGDGLKTGLAILSGISKSASATADANGKAEYDVTVVAVTVDEQGLIHSCVIDSIGATSEFTAEGAPVVSGTVEVKSKNAQGKAYGMKAYGGSTYEWLEQAAALAEFAEGKTIDQVKAGIAGGYASDVDLATSASIYLGGYVAGIEAAVAGAQDLGANTEEDLRLAVNASVTAENGLAQLDVDVAALTVRGEIITSCVIDSLQAKVEYDATGAITTDVTAAPKTKNQLGFDYGMVAYHASPIGKEWFEQVRNFCDYITGKTFAEVAEIAVTVTTAPADVDLAAGTTIAIGGFQNLIAKAATLKTGLAILPGVSKSVSATADANGKAEYDVTVVAVTVDGRGVIRSCIIDSIGASAEFTAEGTPVTSGAVEVKSKNALGYDYGMVVASPIGKEWFEQAAALAAFAEGKTLEELKAGITGGYASDVDLATSATLYLGGYVAGIEAAVANAQNLGATANEELKLAIEATVETKDGVAQMNVDVAVLTVKSETVTSCVIDSLEAKVEFDATGAITTDVTVAPKTKTQLGFDYGMVAYNASPIGKEWFEQVRNFCDYVTGKNLVEINGIAVTVTTAPADVDLATGTTIAIGNFQKLIAKAIG